MVMFELGEFLAVLSQVFPHSSYTFDSCFSQFIELANTEPLFLEEIWE